MTSLAEAGTRVLGQRTLRKEDPALLTGEARFINDLDAPGVYVKGAVDGHEIDGEVVASTPVAAGERATFDVRLDGITVDDIGLLVLLFGADDYGAFVRTA